MNQTYYLDKVVNQIVNETIIGNGEIFAPFLISSLPSSLLLSPSLPFRLLPSLSSSSPSPLKSSFNEYLIMEYGLTEKEVVYVWEQYWDIINNRPNYSKHP